MSKKVLPIRDQVGERALEIGFGNGLLGLKVVEAALGRVEPRMVEAAYRRTDLFERRCWLMDDYLPGER